MIENLDMNYLVPAVITLIGFISYFFGKIISETYPGVEEKSHNYIAGFVFILVHIFLPLAVIYYFQDWLLIKLNIWWGIGFFIAFSFLIKYLDIKKNVFVVTKGQAYEDFEKVAIAKTNEVSSGIGITVDQNYTNKVFNWAFKKMPSKLTLLFLAFIEIFLVSSLIYSTNIIFQVIFIILLMTSMSNLAILVAGTSIVYNNVIVEDNNGKKYKGKIIKYGKEYISMRSKRKVYNFVRENIKYIVTEEKLPFTGGKKK